MSAVETGATMPVSMRPPLSAMPICRHVAVLIPARNEEALLPRCLHSVLAALDALPPEVSCDVIVVSDSSVDRTAELAHALLHRRGTVLRTALGSVGAARAMAARAALQRAGSMPPECCWLANTDADCAVPAGWLLDQLRLQQRGVTAVTGIVDVDCFAEHLPHVRDRFRQTYCIHPDGTHPHVHGANLGVRADSYLRAGGWGRLKTAEDHDLWRRLGETGAQRLADASLTVLTSGRRTGRAPQGFAGALAAHNSYCPELLAVTEAGTTGNTVA